MLKEYPLGEWAPDQAPSKSNHLSLAINAVPIANGYAPVRGMQALTSALGDTFNGGAAYVASDGTSSLLVGSFTALSRYSGFVWSSVYAGSATARWRSTQFGDNAIWSNGGQLVSYDLIAQTAAVIASSPANCIDVCSVKDFVVALRDDDNVEWCEFNNSANWGTGINQADYQPLLDGGRGVGIVGGEYGIILQKNAIKRMSYVGGDVVFQFDKISAEIGCMAQGSICNVGKLIGFLSERGFQICDGQAVTPIGDEKFNRWFFDTYSRDQIEGMWSAVDPRRSLMMWGIPGTPGKIIAYNWVLQRASVLEMSLTGLFTGFTANVSLDALDALYPGGIDTMDLSLDDPSFQGGNPLLLVVDTSNVIGSLSGETLAADFQLQNLEPASGRRSRVRALRPVTDAQGVTGMVSARMLVGDSENLKVCSPMRGNGKMPVRANGRYVTLDLTIPAGTDWKYIQAVEVEFEPGDIR